MSEKFHVKLFMKAADLFDDAQLNSSLCLIFNGIASMVAIAFLVLFAIGKTGTLFWLGVAGCVCMVLANITDLFPFWLRGITEAILGDDAACNEIRARQEAGQLVALWDISIQGGYSGLQEVSIPVGSQYNGRTLEILHCNNGKLETVQMVIENGIAKGKFKNFSAYAVVVTQGVVAPGQIIVEPPKTGDTSGSMPGWFILLLCSALGCTGVLVWRKRQMKET